MVVDGQGFFGCGLGLGHDVAGRENVEKRELSVGVGDACVGQGVGGVFVDRLLKVFEGFAVAFGIAFVPVITAFQIELVGSGVCGVTLGEALFFFASELES